MKGFVLSKFAFNEAVAWIIRETMEQFDDFYVTAVSVLFSPLPAAAVVLSEEELPPPHAVRPSAITAASPRLTVFFSCFFIMISFRSSVSGVSVVLIQHITS